MSAPHSPTMFNQAFELIHRLVSSYGVPEIWTLVAAAFHNRQSRLQVETVDPRDGVAQQYQQQQYRRRWRGPRHLRRRTDGEGEGECTVHNTHGHTGYIQRDHDNDDEGARMVIFAHTRRGMATVVVDLCRSRCSAAAVDVRRDRRSAQENGSRSVNGDGRTKNDECRESGGTKREKERRR